MRSYPSKFIMSKHHCSSIVWYWCWAVVESLTLVQEPETASCTGNGLVSMSVFSFNWSAKVVDMKSDREPLSSNAQTGCPLMCTDTMIGFEKWHAISIVWPVFHSSAVGNVLSSFTHGLTVFSCNVSIFDHAQVY